MAFWGHYGPKNLFFRSLLKRPTRLPTFDFQAEIWYVSGKLSQKEGNGFFFLKLFLTINRQPTSGEVLKPEINFSGPGEKPKRVHKNKTA